MNREINVAITGIGSYVPEKMLTNKDLEKIVDTSDEWIKKRTGISERRILADEQKQVADIGFIAAKKALHNAGLQKKEIELVISVSASPEFNSWPSVAAIIAGKLSIITNAYDTQAACAGFASGLQNAFAQIKSSEYRKVLLVCPKAMSRLLNWKDRTTCILFGDAAAAVVLEKSEEPGIVGSIIKSDGRLHDILKVNSKIKMEGRKVFKEAIKCGEEIIPEILEKYELKIEDIDFFIPHQANQRITDSLCEKLNIPQEKTISNIAKYGNTSSASVPLAIDEIYREGRLKKGNLILTVSFGAGFTWGANIIRWIKD